VAPPTERPGGATAKDAYKSIGIVVVWIVIGMVWLALNPNKHHAGSVDESRTVAKAPAGV